MNNRVISLVQDIEHTISASPEHAPEIIKTLNALLETRAMEHYLGNSEVILQMLEAWLNKKSKIPENSVLTVDVNFAILKSIATEFESLSDDEAADAAEYLAEVFSRSDDLLQIFLSDKLQTPVKQRSPKNVGDDRLKLWLLMSSVRDLGYKEDFFLEVPKNISDEKISSYVNEYYETRGYKASSIHDYGFMIRNGKEMFCVVLTRSNILQVTVHSPVSF